MEYVIALVLVVFGAAVTIPAFGILQRRKLIQMMETSRIGTHPRGYVELKGRIDPIEALESPYAQKPCVYYRFQVQEHRRRGKHSHWVTVRSGSDSRPFLLDDGSGVAWIDPSGAEVDLRQDASAHTGFFGNSDELSAFLARVRVESRGFFGFSNNIRVTESFLSPGDELYVLGRSEEPDPQRGQPPESGAALYGKGEKNLFISDASEESLVTRLLGKAILHFLGGGVLAAAGAAVAWFHATG